MIYYLIISFPFYENVYRKMIVFYTCVPYVLYCRWHVV